MRREDEGKMRVRGGKRKDGRRKAETGEGGRKENSELGGEEGTLGVEGRGGKMEGGRGAKGKCSKV